MLEKKCKVILPSLVQDTINKASGLEEISVLGSHEKKRKERPLNDPFVLIGS